MRRSVMLSPNTKVLLALVTGLGLAACASGQSRAARGSSDVITSEEIRAASDASTAYDLIRRLRPQFLRSRGPTTIRSPQPDEIVVYVNGVNAGGTQILHQLSVIEIQSIRYVNGRDATTRYGTGHGGGVLEITTGH